jgi:hypothetical protein
MADISVALVMMQKDEGELLRAWIEYHRQLFGINSLFVYDNDSTDDLTLRILQKYRDMGMSVNTKFKDLDAHTKRNKIFGDFFHQLDHYNKFDFYFPIDCDEFLVYRSNADSISAEPQLIYNKLKELKDVKAALGIEGTYYNILGQPDNFFNWPQKKTFFGRKTFLSMDSGFHEGRSVSSAEKHYTDFCYMHYHHKPYDLIVEHSKNKLRSFFDPDDLAQLSDPKNKSRLTDFILDGEETYMNRFKTENGVYLPGFRQRLEQIGIKMPF